ncbi:MAG: hypothetical protein FJX73_11865 [Armatimonadetes bacterium]|nr:hypothetical protein [Armatimonadota bacterium]
MSRMRRVQRAEGGIALITVMMAIFILTIVVAAMAIATMGESVLSFDQLRGQQALAVAEAGAYRALAELRHRLAVDLDLQIRQPSVGRNEVRNICRSKDSAPPDPNLEPVDILANYAFPIELASSDWERPDRATAALRIGTQSARITLTDRASGDALGDFYATIAVRPSGRQSTCQIDPNNPEQLVMWFDYAIMSVGRAGNATRTVCLRSPHADRCTNWFPAVSAGWQGSYVLSGGTSYGWPVLIEDASYAQWALMLLDVANVWLYTGTQIYGPVHSNNQIRIAQNPELHDAVTQFSPDMRFLNCGSPVNITIPATNPNAALRTACDNTTGTVFRSTVKKTDTTIDLPTNANPSRTSVGMTPSGPNANDNQVRTATSDDEYFGMPPGPLRDGLYVMDSCGSAACGGVYVRGDITQMVLSSEGGMQVIRLAVPSDPNPLRRNLKIEIHPVSRAVVLYWDYRGGDTWAQSRAYGSGIFNGLFYTSGSITQGGLYGTVNRDMRLTVAAEGEIRVTHHLVYEAPPAGPGHNPTNVLGLYSVTGDVTITGAATPDNLYVDAVVMAPYGRFWVEGFDTLPDKGSIYSLGGTIQGTFGAFGRFSPISGYGRVMTYDWRLRSNVAPPFFPLTDIYTAVRWPSPALVFAGGDPLYDRPHWEEMVGQ